MLLPMQPVLLSLLLLAGAHFATGLQPTAEERARCDAVCVQQAGPSYTAIFDSDGRPSGCVAPIQHWCFYGSYTDPKTLQPGCCGKGNGTFTVDPDHPKEGACCVAPKTYSFNPTAGKGACCGPSTSFSWDAEAGSGGCCAGTADWKCNCTAKPPPPDSPEVPQKCPECDGRIIKVKAIDYQLYCDNGFSIDITVSNYTKSTDIYDCLKQCAENGSKCQGCNYWIDTGDCVMASRHEYPPSGGGNPLCLSAIPLKPKP